jgi:hypothetical protein
MGGHKFSETSEDINFKKPYGKKKQVTNNFSETSELGNIGLMGGHKFSETSEDINFKKPYGKKKQVTNNFSETSELGNIGLMGGHKFSETSEDINFKKLSTNKKHTPKLSETCNMNVIGGRTFSETSELSTSDIDENNFKTKSQNKSESIHTENIKNVLNNIIIDDNKNKMTGGAKSSNFVKNNDANDSTSMSTGDLEQFINNNLSGSVNKSESMSTTQLEQLINENFHGGNANDSTSMSTSQLEQLINNHLSGGNTVVQNDKQATSNTYSEINSTDVNIEQFMINDATTSFNTDEINIINNATTSEIFPNNLKRTR